MSDKKITDLNSVTLPLEGTEELAIVQSGETKKIQSKDLNTDTSYIIQSMNSLNITALNIWFTWNRNTSYILTDKPNATVANTNTNPDINIIPVIGKSKIKGVNFSYRYAEASGDIEICIKSADFGTGGSELNVKTVISEVISLNLLNSGSNELTVIDGEISDNSVLYVFIKRLTGSTNKTQSVQLIYEIE